MIYPKKEKMSLPCGKPIEFLRCLNDEQLFEYFGNYARYIPDAPQDCYVIRCGSQTLSSNDTSDLWRKFEKEVRNEK